MGFSSSSSIFPRRKRRVKNTQFMPTPWLKGKFCLVKPLWLVLAAQDLGEMQGAARRVLGDLLAAAESVCDEDVAGCSGSDGWEQDALGQSLGDGEFFLLEAEGSSHAA